MSSLQYRPAIDGMRAIAVLAVLLFHLDERLLPGGFVGVDIFFVISGYLITSIISKACENGEFSFRQFYQRRIARIFPVFAVVTLAILVAASALYSAQDYASAGALATASAMSIANVKLMLQGNYFEVSEDAQPFLHYWSLSVEEQFYFFLPLILWGAYKLKLSRRGISSVLWGLAVGSFLICAVLTRYEPTWAFYLLPSRAWELLAGCLLATSQLSVGRTYWQRIDAVGSLTGLVCVILSIVYIRESSAFPGFTAIFPVMGTVLLIGCSPQCNSLSERLLAWFPLVWIGRLSYSLYLWHWPVYCFTDYALYYQGAGTRTLLKVSLVTMLSAASFFWLEKPARLRLSQPKRMALAYAFFFSVVGGVVFAGLSIRSSNYIAATEGSVSQGGVVLNRGVSWPLVVLMGDSNGAMYGTVMKQLADEHAFRCHILSVPASNPLPGSQLFADSLLFVNETRPLVVVLAAAWESKVGDDPDKLDKAIEALLASAEYVVLLTQPPQLPELGSRAAIRANGMQPIYEEDGMRARRLRANRLVMARECDRVRVIDVESLFLSSSGEILFVDELGRQLFHDRTHLSHIGAKRVGELLSIELGSVISAK